MSNLYRQPRKFLSLEPKILLVLETQRSLALVLDRDLAKRLHLIIICACSIIHVLYTPSNQPASR